MHIKVRNAHKILDIVINEEGDNRARGDPSCLGLIYNVEIRIAG